MVAVTAGVTPLEHIHAPPSMLVGLSPTSAAPRIRQNWVLNPIQDLLFIIAAPLLSLGLSLWLMQRYGAAQGGAMVILLHVVLTVAHHLPTFIRIYGDVELFQRFKWSFVIGPIIPLLFSAAVLTYLNVHQYPVEYFLYLYIFLALWDPWHFLRQHFGFMRIYDRHNQAPAKLASNMDWAVSGIWFAYIMIASADWIPGLLEDLYRNAHIPLLLAIPTGFMDALQTLMGWVTLITTLIYAGYVAWCWRRGYYVSPAKLALLVCTFGVMLLTYTPNEMILELAPAWSFKVGFATVGIVHMTQYLAIVWRYDQRIAQQGRAKSGWFTWLHGRTTLWGVALAATVYVMLCVGYGQIITTSHDNRLLMSVLLAVGFTSTLMHYYFDGFIWKVRHQQNRVALDMQAESTAAQHSSNDHSAAMNPVIVGSVAQGGSGSSWWQGAQLVGASNMLVRQLLYFAVPMAVLTLGAITVWHSDRTSYVQYMYQAQAFSQQGATTQAAEAARKAYRQMQKQLPMARKLAELKPSAAHQAELAFLIYNESLYANVIMPALAGRQSTTAQQQQHRQHIAEAAELLISADYQGGELGHPGRDNLTHDEARAIALSWQRQLG